MKRSRLERRTPLKAKSAKTAERDRERRGFREDVLIRRPWCEIGPVLADAMGDPHRWTDQQFTSIGRALTDCTARSVDLHEPLKRSRRGSVLDPENVIACCRSCHRFTEEEVALSTELGLLRPSWTR